MHSNNIDITQIQSKLQTLGLIRNQETIKNWMNSENLIAPRNRVFDLKYFINY